MLANDTEEKIIDYLKNNSDEFHPSQVKPIAYAVYGGGKINVKNISSLVVEIYSILCKLEKDGKVKNDNPFPVSSPQAMAASRWYYAKK